MVTLLHILEKSNKQNTPQAQNRLTQKNNDQYWIMLLIIIQGIMGSVEYRIHSMRIIVKSYKHLYIF